MIAHQPERHVRATTTIEALERRLLLAVQPVADAAVGHIAAVVGGTLFFTVASTGVDAATAKQLWKSDGTSTRLVKEFDSDIEELAGVNGTLFINVDSDLWKSDGTSAGTNIVEDLPGIFSTNDPEQPETYGSAVVDIAAANGKCVYLIEHGSTGEHELVETDGTPAGRSIVAGGYLSNVVAAGPVLYFINEFSTAAALYRMNGSGGGNEQVTLLPFPTDYWHLTDVNGTLFFFQQIFSRTVPLTLWTSNGTAAGTTKVLELGYRDETFPPPGVGANGIFYFNFNGDLWRSDGSAAGTARVKDFATGTGDLTNVTNVNGTIYFAAAGAGGVELWRSDGTEAGTVRVADINPGNPSSMPRGLANVNGTLYFGADDADGAGLFKLDTVMRVDGTAVGEGISATVVGGNLEVRIDGQLVKSAPIAETTLLEIRAGDGDDVIDCSTLSIPVFASGGNGNDKIAGGTAPDTLGGGAGKDTIDGGLGNDRLNGHGGHDRLFGNAGGDRLYGYDGNDLLDGGSSGDRLYGGNGNDTMFGASGNDRFFAAGDAAVDQLFGGTGDDTAARDASDLLASVERST